MGMFAAFKDNVVLKAFSKKLQKNEEEEKALREEQKKQYRERMKTLRCCANCKHRIVEEKCFAIMEFCSLYGHQITVDDAVCTQFGWAESKQPKHEDTTVLTVDAFGHAEVKENNSGEGSL